jgi:predicted dehydrogenase
MLRWVVAGIGDIAVKRVLPAIQAEPRSELYGVVTRDPAKGRSWSERVWTDLEPALADPAVDAVYIATPVFRHAPQSVAAMRAGRHVLCEKPMAMNLAEAREMVQTARQSGVKFGVAYYRRFYPKLLRAAELIRAGVIGQVVFAELTCHHWFTGADGYRSWLIDPTQAGGGPLYDIASHRIDVLNFLFGRPARVSAHLANAVHRYAVEDAATVLIEYESGVRGLVDVRWNSKVARDECRILGTEGELNLTPLNDPPLAGPGIAEQIPLPPNPHLALIVDFVAAVLDGKEPASSGETAIWTDAVTAAAVAADRSSRTVPTP